MAEADVLPDGARVRVRGLVGAAQHNGKTGTIQMFVANKGRYAVALAGGGPTLLIKPANVVLRPPEAKAPADWAGALQQLKGNVVDTGKFSFRSLGDHADDLRAALEARSVRAVALASHFGETAAGQGEGERAIACVAMLNAL